MKQQISIKLVLFLLSFLSLLNSQAFASNSSYLELIKKDNLKGIQEQLAEEDLSQLSIDGEPLLHIAVLNKARKITRWLIEQPIDIDQTDTQLHNALTHSLLLEDYRTAKLLINNNALVNYPLKEHQLNQWAVDQLPLASLVFNNASIRAIDWLISNGGTLSSEFKNKNLYSLALVSSNTALIERFLELSPIPFEQPFLGGNFEGVPVSILACFRKNETFFEKAIEKKLDVNMEYNHASLLSYCLVKDNLATVVLLINSGAKITKNDITKAAQTDHKLYEYLVAAVKSQKQIQIDLVTAVLDKDLDKIKKLIAAGFDINTDFSVNNFQCAPCVQMHELINAIPELKQQSVTLLLVAVQQNDKKLVEYLLELGANANQKSQYGQTALSSALEIQSSPIISTLLEHGAELSDYQVSQAINSGQYRLVIDHLNRNPTWLDYWAKNNPYDIDNVVTKAIQAQHDELLLSLVSAGFRFDQTSPYFYPINLAIDSGDMELVKLIVNNTDDLTRYQYNNPLVKVIALQQHQNAAVLIEKGFKLPDYLSKETQEQVSQLLSSQEPLTIQLCRQAGFNPYALEQELLTAKLLVQAIALCPHDFSSNGNSYKWLSLLIESSNFTAAQTMIESGADINNTPYSQDPSLLEQAISRNSMESVKFLVKNKVSIKASNDFTFHPIITAIKKNQTAIALYLVKQLPSNKSLRIQQSEALLPQVIELRNKQVLKKLRRTGARLPDDIQDLCRKEISTLVFCRDNNLVNNGDELLKESLANAVFYQRIQRVKEILSLGGNPNLMSVGKLQKGESLLMNAASRGNLELVETLLVSGANANTLSNNRSALSFSVTSDNLQVFEKLFMASNKLVQNRKHIDSLYIDLSFSRKESLLKWLLRTDNKPPSSLLQKVAGWCSAELVSELLLIKNGSYWSNSEFSSALYSVVSPYDKFYSSGDLDKINLHKLESLIAAGADLHGRDHQKLISQSPQENNLLSQAIQNGSIPIVDKLLKLKIKLPSRFDDYADALWEMANRPDLDSLERILIAGANPDTLVNNSNLLAYAISENKVALFDLLIAHGSDPNQSFQFLENKTPLSLAILTNQYPIIETLISSGSRVNQRDGGQLGLSPLMLAVELSQLKTVELLLSNGANPNASDYNSRSISQRLKNGTKIASLVNQAIQSNKNTQIEVELNIANSLWSQQALDTSPNKKLSLRQLFQNQHGVSAVELWDNDNQRALRILKTAKSSLDDLVLSAFLSDKEAIIGFGGSSNVSIINLANGAIIREIAFDHDTQYPKPIQAAALSTDKKKLILSTRQSVRLIEIAKSKVIKSWSELTLEQLQFSKDQTEILAVGSDQNLITLGIKNNSLSNFDHFYQHQIKEPQFIRLIDNDRLLLASGDNSTSSSKRDKAWIFNIKVNKIEQVFDFGVASIKDIQLSDDHKSFIALTHSHLIYGNFDNRVINWKVPLDTLSKQYSHDKVTFSSNTEVILSSDISNHIEMVDLTKKKVTFELEIDSLDSIRIISSIENGSIIASDGKKLVRLDLQKLRDKEIRNKLKSRTFTGRIIALVKKNKTILAITNDDLVHELALPSLTINWSKPLYNDKAFSKVCLERYVVVSAINSSNNEFIIKCSSLEIFDGKSGLYSWSSDSGEINKVKSEWDSEAIHDFAVDPITDRLFTAGPGIQSNTYVKQVDLRNSNYSSKHLIKREDHLSQSINALAVNNSVLLSGSRDKNELKIWNQTSKKFSLLKNNNAAQDVNGITINKNASRSLNWQTNWLEIWDIKDRKLISQLQTNQSITAAAFVNSDELLVATNDGRVHRYSANGASLLYSTEPLQSRVSSLDVSDDGKEFIITARNLQRRDALTGQLVSEIKINDGLASQAFFLGKQLLQLGIDNHLDESGKIVSRIAIYNLKTNKLIATDNHLRLIAQSANRKIYATHSKKHGIQVWNSLTKKLIRAIPLERFDTWQNAVAINDHAVYVSGAEYIIRYGLSASSLTSNQGQLIAGTGKPFKRSMSYSEDKAWAVNIVNEKYSEWFRVLDNQKLGCVNANLYQFDSVQLDSTSLELILQKDNFEKRVPINDKECALLPNKFSKQVTTASQIPLWQVPQNIQGYRAGIASLSVIAPSHSHIAMVKDNFAHILSLQTGSMIGPILTDNQIIGLKFSPSGRILTTLQNDGGFKLWDSDSGTFLFSASAEFITPETVSFNQNESELTIDSYYPVLIEETCDPFCNERISKVRRAKQTWSLTTQQLLSSVISEDSFEKSLLTQKRIDNKGNSIDIGVDGVYSKMGWGQKPATLSDDQTMTAAFNDKKLLLWTSSKENEKPKTLYQTSSYQPPSLIAFVKNNRFLIAVQPTGELSVYQTNNGERVARLKLAANSTWLALDEYGRYDSNSPGDLPFASWVTEDTPLEGLPVEVFMNDFFVPRLLPRILSNETFKPLTSIASLNRLRPEVSIDQIVSHDNNGLVDVTVSVSEQRLENTNSTASSKAGDTSGYQGIRLFRNGKQVGFSATSSLTEKNSIDGLKKSTIHFKDIQIPRSDNGSALEFTSYAFNRDNIKSASVKKQFRLTPNKNNVKPRAFVVTIGVNEYQNPAWNLTYATPDANVLHQQVINGLKSTKHYSDVIGINLTTDSPSLNPSKQLIEAVFAKLAGKTSPLKQGESIAAINKLQRVHPNDTVLVSYSGHGYASKDGGFHLFPFDIAKGSQREITPELLLSTITSIDLNRMLRDIDSENFMMVIDACNSSASVEGKDFRPGPMGSSGLGQLAFNKQMMILTASQAEEFALESDQLNHGLLTYSLVEEGLKSKIADRLPKDDSISAREWLSYAISRVPELYHSLMNNAAITNSRGIKVIPVSNDQTLATKEELVKVVSQSNEAQRPGLFDFSKKNKIVISEYSTEE